MPEDRDDPSPAQRAGDPPADRSRAAERRAALRADGEDDATDDDPPLPRTVVDDAERLTRLARRATVPDEADAYREDRDRLLAEHDYAATIRDDEGDDVLVCHPAEWRADGAIVPELIDDVDRAVEVPLEGAGDPEAWEAVDERNRAVVRRVREAHGPVHGANAAALADYAGNHLAKPMAAITAEELAVFREEYYVRNAWPSDEQRAVLEESLALVSEALDVPLPTE